MIRLIDYREEMLTKNGMLQEAIIYLNITLHRMRAAAQRQTNRGATMTSQLERLGLEGRRTSKKFTVENVFVAYIVIQTWQCLEHRRIFSFETTRRTHLM